MKTLFALILLFAVSYTVKAGIIFKKCPYQGLQTWMTIDNYTCYLFSSHYQRLTWHDAEERCQSYGGHLMSIHDADTNKMIISYSKSHYSYAYSYWIGLSAPQKILEYKWSDGTPRDYGNFSIINPVNPKVIKVKYDPYAQGRCVSVNKVTGVWQYNDCNDDYIGFICQKSPTTNSDTKIQSTPTPPGNCPIGWIQFSNKKCVQIIDGGFTHQQAADKCHSLQADLLAIHSKEEQYFITSLMANSGKAWIGLTRKSMSGSYKWSWHDQSKVNFVNWAPTKPSAYTNYRCVGLINNELQAGKWENVNCDVTQNAICEKSKDATISTPPPSPFPSCNITGYENSDMIQYRNSCYKFIDTQMQSWDEAQVACKQMTRGFAVNLVSIIDPYEHAFINYYAQQKLNSDVFWIGFYANETNERNVSDIVFQWSDQWPNYFTYWDKYQPDINTHDDKQCVYQFSANGSWATGTCNEKKPFICKVTSSKIPDINNDESGICPSFNSDMPGLSAKMKMIVPDKAMTWKNLDKRSKYCYWFSADLPRDFGLRSWSEASFHCRHRNGTLVSIHSQHELNLLRYKITNSLKDTWIGLYQSNGEFMWEDGSGVDFTNWSEGQPDHESQEYCVEVRAKDLKWTQKQCGWKSVDKFFICQIPKLYHSRITLSNSDSKSSQTGLSNGAIAGIAILVLLLVVVIAGGTFIISRRHQKKNPEFSFQNQLHANQRFRNQLPNDAPNVNEEIKKNFSNQNI